MDYHEWWCPLITAIKVLDDIVDWAVQETFTAIETEEEVTRGVHTVELPEEEERGRGPVEAPPLTEG